MSKIDVHLTNDGLVLGDKERTGKKIIKGYMSPSAMNSLADGCPASWAAGRLRPFDEDPLKPNGTGNVVHSVMEELFALAPNQRTRETILRLWADKQAEYRRRAETECGLFYSDEEWASHFAHYDEAVLRVLDPSYVGGEDLVADRVSVIGTEIQVGSWSKPIDIWGVPSYGKVDRLDNAPGGKSFMRDYKLRALVGDGRGGLRIKPMPSAADKRRYGDPYGHQQRIYNEGLRVLGYPEMVGAELLYLGSAERCQIDLSRGAMESTRRRLRTTWDRYRRMCDERTFPYKVGTLCAWCPLVEVCPAATASKGGNTPSPRRTDQPFDVLSTSLASGHHGQVSTPTPKEKKMAQQQHQSDTVPPRWGLADKPWKDSTARGPNIGSYGAGTVFGLVSLAWETMVRVGVPPHLVRANIRPLAETFASVVAQSADDAVGFKKWNDDSIPRFSGVLRTFLEHGPSITDALVAGPDGMEKWATQAREFSGSVSAVALRIITGTPSFQEEPWNLFVAGAPRGQVSAAWSLTDKSSDMGTPNRPNIGSHGAGTAFGIVQLAWELLTRAGLDPQVRGRSVEPLSMVLASVVAQSAADAVEFDNWNDGSIQRFSGALRTFLEYGVNIAGALTLDSQIQVAQEVSSWARQARAFCAAAAGASLDMTTRPPSFQDTPWKGISWQTPTPNNQKESNE